MRIRTYAQGWLALGAFAVAAALAGCLSDPCHANDPPGAAPTLDPSTLADTHDRLRAHVYVGSSSGVLVTLTAPAAGSCPVLTATATLNGQSMAIEDNQRQPQLVPASCDGDTQCCTSSYYACGDLEFSSPAVPSAPLDLTVSDASGPRKISVALSGAFPSFSMHGSNVLVPGQRISLDVAPPDALAQEAYVSSSNAVIFSGIDFAQSGAGVSFVVPPLDEVFDASAPLAECTDPTADAMTVPCSAGLTVQFETFPVTTVTSCDFGSCSADVDTRIGFTPIVVSSPVASDAGDAAADGA